MCSMISSTRQFNMVQNISMVWVLTLSLRLSRVIWAGLIFSILLGGLGIDRFYLGTRA